jgi:hypothetical protein
MESTNWKIEIRKANTKAKLENHEEPPIDRGGVRKASGLKE